MAPGLAPSAGVGGGAGQADGHRSGASLPVWARTQAAPHASGSNTPPWLTRLLLCASRVLPARGGGSSPPLPARGPGWCLHLRLLCCLLCRLRLRPPRSVSRHATAAPGPASPLLLLLLLLPSPLLPLLLPPLRILYKRQSSGCRLLCCARLILALLCCLRRCLRPAGSAAQPARRHGCLHEMQRAGGFGVKDSVKARAWKRRSGAARPRAVSERRHRPAAAAARASTAVRAAPLRSKGPPKAGMGSLELTAAGRRREVGGLGCDGACGAWHAALECLKRRRMRREDGGRVNRREPRCEPASALH